MKAHLDFAKYIIFTEDIDDNLLVGFHVQKLIMFSNPYEVVSFELLGRVVVVFWKKLYVFSAKDISVKIDAKIGDGDCVENGVDIRICECFDVCWNLSDWSVIATLPFFVTFVSFFMESNRGNWLRKLELFS